MTNVNKTCYITLYGKSFVSKKGIIINDPMAEEIWAKEGFELKGKSKSKWLAYYMSMRAMVFDNWVKEKLSENKNAIVLHIGCGMDSRIERTGVKENQWFDIDFESVITERKKHYKETDYYHMIVGDASKPEWVTALPKNADVIVILEGISMYLKINEIENLLRTINNHFNNVNLLIDCYTELSAKMSKYKNPINDVGVTMVYGLDEPKTLEKNTGLSFIKEHNITPPEMINQLKGFEKSIFKVVFGGKFSKKMYRLYEYKN
ncbi:MAG: class I SAM-dependent methyltransferase [Acutalibacteraceae bacterium]|nr:class I SAM-dependent methyltransferase [Acutalibacteraceae bacterium]